MRLIELLLTELGGAAFAQQARQGLSHSAHEAVLSLSNGTVLLLDMSTDEEHLVLSSAVTDVPAWLEASALESGPGDREVPDPEPDHAVDRLLLDHRHQQLVVQRCVARGVLGPDRFKRELARCAECHDHWRRVIETRQLKAASAPSVNPHFFLIAS